MAFEGFSPQMGEFFMKIRFNNNVEFFNEHRKDYERYVKDPLYSFAQDVSEPLQQIDPEIETRPGKVVSRIRRDTRFAKDKSPYRDHMWITWRPSNLDVAKMGKSVVPCLYFSMNIDTWDVGAGFYEATPLTMRSFRARVAASPNGFLSIVKNPDFARTFTLGGEDYKRPKLPVDLPEELIPWYSKKSFYVNYSQPIDGQCAKASFAQTIAGYLRLLGPLYQYLSSLPIEE